MPFFTISRETELMMEIASCTCNQCGDTYTLTHFECSKCSAKFEGQFSMPRLARLAPEERQFVELFLLAGGNIKKMEKALGISYPTVKSKLEKIVSTIGQQIAQEVGNPKEDWTLFENIGLENKRS